MNTEKFHLNELAGKRLNLQRNYEPKLRKLVEIRSKQLGFNDVDRNNALRSIDALMWKLTASGIHLERLWEYRESSLMQQLLTNLNSGNLEPKRFTDKEVAYLTAEFEAFLIPAYAFINITKIHTLDACRVKFGGMLTSTKYKTLINKAHEDIKPKLMRANNYFEQNVFGLNQWGSILKSLRDRVVHFDRIRPSKVTSNEGLEDLTVAGQALEHITQDFENITYDLLVNVIAPIWDREWKAGKYQPGMWS